jgi:predicted flap endonuclease-1-like 5' DNA nuclease
MFYLFMQTLFWIILAFVVGLITGWWLRGFREKESPQVSASVVLGNEKSETTSQEVPVEVKEPEVVVATEVPVEKAVSAVTEVETSEVMKPENAETVVTAGAPPSLIMDPETKDDLKRIKGVGPVIEKTLNKLGIWNFKQIAELTPDNVQWVEDHISFPGRVVREGWIEQAHKLGAGEQTEFSKRVDTGNVSYDKD